MVPFEMSVDARMLRPPEIKALAAQGANI